LTSAGTEFLDDARRVLQTHDAAARRAFGRRDKRSFEIGVSDHAAGELLPGVLASLYREMADTQLLVTVGNSGELLAAFERGAFDVVVGRGDEVGAGDEIVLGDRLAWIASSSFK
jgi:DNA-binding transcriptional LysR family regulator